ncbi:PREDICTED: glutaminyl-peptide cyclotransferase-like [Papilio polytes]|uniref:glutaminyl-peptide cyclotransferase-like n=1 Tax=Papilio polytes TaxID=76194 RepID=UPI0006767BEB|nr:PREDICTED: glutaminyl-peptide cyclotransferase-like [Papilio polytes]
MVKLLTYVITVLLSLVFVNTKKATVEFYEEKAFHEANDLTDSDIKKIAKLSDQTHFKEVLDEILIPRVVGTPNHEKVGNFIVKQMKDLGWDVTEDIFSDKTPVFGMLNFRNIIAKLNPEAERYLVLACHYESKYTREHVFVGATDSAVPCAMMINLAKVMSKQLDTLKTNRLSLMLLFFDDGVMVKFVHCKKYKDVLVLLDLLGCPDPVFYSYFQATEKWYVRLAGAEQRLAELGQLSAYSVGKEEQTYFRLRSSGAFIDDDHVPFLKRNVNVVHVIPNPFPSVWHTADDDMSALDFNTIDNLNKIFRVFVAEYLHLHP